MARVGEGSPEPLGVSLTARGVNVAVWSRNATAIEFCLFDTEGEVEVARIALPGRTGPVFHGSIEGVGQGARYGLRAHGPYAPARGHRFNPDKLLVDPWALAIDRPFALHPSMFGYRAGAGETSRDDADSAPFTPKAIVVATPAAPPPSPPIVPWRESVVYELHVRGFTKTHPDIPEPLRGTFAGLAHPAAIDHLKRLGVTTVELMPCAAWVDERHLVPLGLGNYWGYNPIAPMAPDPRLAPGGWAEVLGATQALAGAGIECILDVVFNHTGEGDELGPTLGLRGLDNAGYYRLDPDDPSRYANEAGCGNILALDRPAGVRLVMDALRAWRRLGGVAGFRFDLATVLGRRADGFDPAAPLISAIDQDPELRGLKLIAEPWDIGPGGYQLGAFPPHWGEWNDRFRDTLRGFWRGDGVSLGALAGRLAGSHDLFAESRPSRSINYIVAHDGFTLADLVAYEAKHNEANGEDGRDGTSDNLSWNNGAEGPSDDPRIRAARARDQRALIASLILARGTPMLAMGCEFGHTQGGNNNAYAQDNAASWLDWAGSDQDLLAFSSRLVALRQRYPMLRDDQFLTGEASGSALHADVAWLQANGAPLTAAEWDDPSGETLVMVLSDQAGGAQERVAVAIHRGREALELTLPEPRDGFAWTILADSDDPARSQAIEARLGVAPRSVLLLAEAASPRARRARANPEVLDRLARAAGISPSWSDVDGHRHDVSPETEQALLAAMNLPAGTSQQALQSLHRLAETHDRRALPFTLVRRAGEPADLVLASDAGAPVRPTWVAIEADGGAVHRVRVGLDNSAETAIACRDGRTAHGLSVSLPALPVGRYRVRREDRPDIICDLTIAPAACHLPDALRSGRLIGLSAQVYALRRQGDQGIGDFATLGLLGEAAARAGAAVLGINPMHALFDGRRDRASPYYPSDRRFLDPIYLDLGQVAGASAATAATRRLSALPAIDHAAVWTLKRQALEASFIRGQPHPGFAAFVTAGGAMLAKFAAFEAIAEAHVGLAWSDWPTELRDPDGAGVRAFAEAHRPRVRFHQYLQWLCERQLAAAAEHASGLALGFCRDLAIGAAPDGAEVWSQSGLIAHGVSIGAPPDPLGPDGQVWGLPPFDPNALKADGYRSVATLLAANMRHAGALRIDHVLGLTRQFWIPDGAPASDGAYVAFPLDDLLGELALESERAGCIVVGEDLGTVPDGLRARLAEAAVLSYRVLPFERDGARFLPPEDYPALAWACAATHDLPPLAGWWEGIDIDERLELGLTTELEAAKARTQRAADRAALVAVLGDAGLAQADFDPEGPLTPALAAAIHGFIARTPSMLAVVQAEDLAGERTPVNLPGTDRERPNWRRRIATPLERLFETGGARAILDAMRAERPAPPPADDQPASAKPS